MTDFFALALHSFWTFVGTLILLPVLAMCVYSVADDTFRGLATIIRAIRGKE